MPKRTNLFQDVVAIIQRHLAGEAEVEESALLAHTLTGESREVDVVIRSTVGNHPVLVALEATATKRPAAVTWVEQMLQKHRFLPTDKLILVSQNGFTKDARALAERHAVTTIAPVDLDVGDPDRALAEKLPSLWPKIVSLTPERVRVHVRRPDGAVVWFKAARDHIVFTDTGAEVATLEEAIMAQISASWKKITDDIDLANIAESMTRIFVLVIEPWVLRVDNAPIAFCMRDETVTPPEFHPIAKVEVVGKAEIEVQHVVLSRHKLGEVKYAYGQTSLQGRDSLIVVTEDDAGQGLLTLRVAPEGRSSKRSPNRKPEG